MEFENLLQLIEKVSESELTGLKYEEGGVKLHLTKKHEGQPVISGVSCETVQGITGDGFPLSGAAKPAGHPGEEAKGKIVESPLVGTFYAAPAEDAGPFVSKGDTVKEGQTLAIVEAMKLMNEIESDYSGTIAEIYVSNGETVEYGQPLFRIQ